MPNVAVEKRQQIKLKNKSIFDIWLAEKKQFYLTFHILIVEGFKLCKSY
jgi:hypothetical protein